MAARSGPALARHLENEPKPGTPEADRADLLALVIEHYEGKRAPIKLLDTIDAIRYPMDTGGYPQTGLGRGCSPRASAHPTSRQEAFSHCSYFAGV